MTDLQTRAVQTIRFLCADAVQKANSGHPGLPMGTAAIAYTIWTRHLRHNPKNPRWFNRDRFILSGGHGSTLLYSLLHLTGYDLSLEEIKSFRQLGSLTPGHPEYGLTPGVETTTGPLGQGFSNGIGMAIAEAHLADGFNQPDFQPIDHFVFGIVTDGDLMEGVTSEAASLAGHLKLGKIIYCYDDNRISIDGSTELAFTEDRGKRFEAYGWQVIRVGDGNDVEAIDQAICLAKTDARPSLIICRTHIGFGLPTKQDTSKAHGEPPGEEELENAKRLAGWPGQEAFFIPDDVLDHFRRAIQQGDEQEKEWKRNLKLYIDHHPDLGRELSRRLEGELPDHWRSSTPNFDEDKKGIATRSASGKVINALGEVLPELMGGSADLTPSTNTWINSSQAFQANCRSGRNIHFGVREHGMGAIINGMAVHGGIIPFGATFAVFSDYLRGALRVSALSHFPSVWVFTHDSIGLGEDGPTHQPVEHLATLRAIPGLCVIRPGDANETAQAWEIAIQNRSKPTALLLTRQACRVFSPAMTKDGVQKGAYVLHDPGDHQPQIILMATGSEVSLVYEAALMLEKEGIKTRVVSFPSWDLFEAQDESYRTTVLPPEIRARIAVEAAVQMGWERWIGDKGSFIGMKSYGASAPYRALYERFGLTAEHVVEKAKALLKNLERSE